MKVVIATFERPEGATAFGRALREDFGVSDKAIGEAKAGASGESYDGHRLVAAWVPRHLRDAVRASAVRHEGVLHEPPAYVVRPAWVGAPRTGSEDHVSQAERLGIEEGTRGRQAHHE